ncbi:MAG: oxygen-independent coproporphyrinogen III oxidase-like protein [Paludibacterium sp.]|uniref:radical SAM family heme chaperone HemW n=1 Tax=Paludibacterium sp. TaxID=1917523 RepID=UPI0025D91DE0|nr:radical SAM family heme chaperone HemW [Paludibacterium sp.]MBV8048633.1 oxygen-independent coproporphyrinogen III oxidase-like protein [Paludibacterium sp.]MBV8649111.1 oxygen-independent coproporphyrinogen III oxidase-like protein [Paludibacterium sp.]
MTQVVFTPRAGLTQLPPLSLYVHFPWCVRKCPYCDFNSHEARAGIDDHGYVAALLRDLEQALPAVWGRAVQTVFIGGGTPSLMSPEALATLLDGIRARVRLDPEAEITLEANPGTFEAEKFKAFRVAGVNRLSVGIQSFDDAQLQRLGRIHDSRQAHAALDIALAHFDNVNLDLMYALPQQTLVGALSDLSQGLAHGVTHLSAYQLTIEPNTLFHRYQPADLPDDDLAADMQEALEARLADAGFSHYETSAFARAGRQCRHNLNYWRFGDYLGIGAGAHAKISSAEGIVREMRHKQPAAYLQAVAGGDAAQTRQRVARSGLPFEFMMNALRLVDGFELAWFSERTGVPLADIQRELNQAESRGFIARSATHLRPTLTGQRFLNDLLTLFLKSE